jgi:hypothetical protein
MADFVFTLCADGPHSESEGRRHALVHVTRVSSRGGHLWRVPRDYASERSVRITRVSKRDYLLKTAIS